MEENGKRPESSPSGGPDPERLLRGLDLELGQMRATQEGASAGRLWFRVLSLVFILGGAMIALYILSSVLEEMRPQHAGSPTPAGEQP